LLRLLVDAGLRQAARRDLREELVGVALLVERLVEEVLRVVVAELAGQGPRRSVRRDLVVLDALRCGDERCVLRGGVPAARLDDLFALLDEALHGLAFLAVPAFAELPEDLLDPVPVVLRSL